MNLLTYLPSILNGLLTTIILMLASLLFGLLLAISMTAINFSKNNIAKFLVNGLVFFVRGTPILIQIFLIYYGLGQFAFIRQSPFWYLLQQPMVCAILALGINSACYTSVLLQGGIRSVPRNEIDACYALGMSKWLAFRRIIIRRAFRIIMPAYSNEVIMILKGTSLASTITLLDLMGVIQQLIAQTYNIVTFYIIAAVLYLILHGIIMYAFKHLCNMAKLPT